MSELKHVSEKPWSSYTEADYTLGQYKAACLVVRGDGSTKEQCKLPVKTPNGALSRAGVHAAAASLAGARGGVQLNAEERASAKKKLIGLYKKLSEEPPPSLMHAVIDSSSSTTAAIMAIPSPLESIRLVGDEDKHATLLYFGETDTLPDDAKETLTDAVKMASTMLFPFSEGVREVSRLGPETPPALVAMLTGDDLSQIRNLFLMNPSIKGYLDNTAQFPLFTPHVTLGYPDYTDEVILRSLMQSIYGVRFDRLSLWWNDEQIEFNLDLAPEDNLAMTNAVENFIEHFGIKGQKWGVRRSVDSATGRVEQTGTTGLKPRTGSADQIEQDRIASKIAKGGVESVSNSDIQAFTRRLQLQKDLSRVLAEQSAAEKAKADGFIKKFVKNQSSRQFDRVANKAVDIAVEKALESAGLKVGKKNPGLGEGLHEVSKRLKPKKK